VQIQFKEQRTVASFTSFVKRVTQPAVTELATSSDLEKLTETTDVVFTLFVNPSTPSTALSSFTKACQRLRTLAHCTFADSSIGNSITEAQLVVFKVRMLCMLLRSFLTLRSWLGRHAAEIHRGLGGSHRRVGNTQSVFLIRVCSCN
jgi:hypothetical protein